jgi:hypothetical protein
MPRVERRCCATSCVARGQAARSSGCARASGAAAQRPRTDHPEEGIRRWDGRGRHGSAIAPLPARDQRASTTIPHDPLCGGARRGESVALARQRAASPRGTPPLPQAAENVEPEKRVRKSGYRPWAELLERTFAVDVLVCPGCQGRMRLLAVVKNPLSIARYLAAAGELTDGAQPGLGPCRAARLVAARPTGRVKCSGDRRSVTRATARTTAAKATRQRKKRRRKRWFRRGGGALGTARVWRVRRPSEASSDAPPCPCSGPPGRPLPLRGHAN